MKKKAKYREVYSKYFRDDYDSDFETSFYNVFALNFDILLNNICLNYFNVTDIKVKVTTNLILIILFINEMRKMIFASHSLSKIGDYIDLLDEIDILTELLIFSRDCQSDICDEYLKESQKIISFKKIKGEFIYDTKTKGNL